MSKVAFVIRKDENNINSFEDMVCKADADADQRNTYNIEKDKNDAHPDKQGKLETIDTLSRADAFRWVAEGKHDAYPAPPDPFDDTSSMKTCMVPPHAIPSSSAASPVRSIVMIWCPPVSISRRAFWIT